MGTIRLRIDNGEDLSVAQDLAVDTQDLTLEAVTKVSTDRIGGQMEPVTAVMIGAGVTLLATFVNTWWERRRGGLVLDQRSSAQDQIYRDPDLPYGYVVIYAKDGDQVKVEVKDAPKDAMHQLLETVIEKSFASATEAVGTVREVLGSDARVTD